VKCFRPNGLYGAAKGIYRHFGGKLVFHILVAFAEFERRLIIERTRRNGMQAARAREVRSGPSRAIPSRSTTPGNSSRKASAARMRLTCSKVGRTTLYRAPSFKKRASSSSQDVNWSYGKSALSLLPADVYNQICLTQFVCRKLFPHSLSFFALPWLDLALT
jgi:Resolvase, N terminal domain